MDKRIGGFRSRGLRFYKKENGPLCQSMKEYYELDGTEHFPEEASKFVNDGILMTFEKALRMDGTIDAFNFHATFSADGEDCILSPLSKEERQFLSEIPVVFSARFRLYTVGYRMKEDSIIGRTYYVYPVAWKGDHWGIRGVADAKEIAAYGRRFCNWISVKKSALKDIVSFLSYTEKFKGISITFSQRGMKTLKLYTRMKPEHISLWLERFDVDVTPYVQKFGPVVLCALRMNSNDAVFGSNLYFLR